MMKQFIKVFHLRVGDSKRGAMPTPTGITANFTGYAPQQRTHLSSAPTSAVHPPQQCTQHATGHPVPTCTHSTCVMHVCAVIGQMAPALTLQAMGGLLLTFLSVNSLLTDNQAAGEHFVSNVGSRQ